MWKFFFAAIKLLVAFFATLFVRHKNGCKNIMLVSEKGDDARDNGYHFFLYVKQHHPELEAYYVITDHSPDRPRLSEYESSLVSYLSFRHCVVFWKAHYLVGTHLRAGHTPMPFVLVRKLRKVWDIYRGKIVVNLKHGITKGYMDRLRYENTGYNLLVCGAAPEVHDFMVNYHYPSTVAKYTGFCRFDKLLDFQVKRQILVMPTWRNYIHPDRITDSLFYRSYRNLLTDSCLASLLDEYNIDLIFYPHHRFQPVVSQFKQGVTSPHIIIADLAHYDVQQLLKESALMITDYSSVLFDFVYMKKPVIFFQFDREDFLGKHIPQGYVDESSFGPIMYDVDGVIASLSGYLKDGMRLAPQYDAEVDRFFPIRDTRNCERVFDAVMNCQVSPRGN